MELEKILESLSTVEINFANPYILEFQAAEGTPADLARQVAWYIGDSDLSIPLPSGIPELDEFLDRYCKLSKQVESAGMHDPANNELADKDDLLEQFCIYLLAHGKEAFYITEESDVAKELFQLIRSSQGCIDDDVDLQLKDMPNELIALYEQRKTGEDFFQSVATAAANYGCEYLIGDAACPVELFKNQSKEECGFPASYDAVEFVYFIIQELVKQKEPELARNVATDYDDLLPLLSLGRIAYERHDSFVSENCGGCICSPSVCDFMKKNRRQVATGEFYGECPEKDDGNE